MPQPTYRFKIYKTSWYLLAALFIVRTAFIVNIYYPDYLSILNHFGQLILGLSIMWIMTWGVYRLFSRSNVTANTVLCFLLFVSILVSVASWSGRKQQVQASLAATQTKKLIGQTRKDYIDLLEENIETGENANKQHSQLVDKLVEDFDEIAQNASGNDKIYMKVVSDFLRHMQSHLQKYNEALSALMTHGGPDVTTLHSTNDIIARKQLIHDFRNANEEFDQAYAKGVETLTDMAIAAGIDKRNAKQFAISVRKGAHNWDIIRKMRDCDRRVCDTLEQILDLLNDNWAAIVQDPVKQVWGINNDEVLSKYTEIFNLLQQAANEQLDLQKQMVQTQKKHRPQ